MNRFIHKKYISEIIKLISPLGFSKQSRNFVTLKKKKRNKVDGIWRLLEFSERGTLFFSSSSLAGPYNVITALFLVGVVAAGLWWGCLSHPFLLADNRHFTFYIWRRILAHPIRRIMLVPFYAFSLFFVSDRLLMRRGPIWILIFTVAVCLTLLPAHLFEPRYFNPGVLLSVLNFPVESKFVRRLSILIFVLINIATIYVFKFLPFTWTDGSAARFMY